MARPLVVRFGALGDMVLMTVPIRILHERFGVPVDIVGSGAWTLPLLSGQYGVGNIYQIGSRRPPYWLSFDQRRLVRTLKQRGAGPTWLFDANTKTIERLLVYAGWQKSELLGLDVLEDIKGEHFCDRWRRFAEMDSQPQIAAKRTLPIAIPRLDVPQWARSDIENLLKVHRLADRPYVLIQPGNKRTMRRGRFERVSNTKYWPPKRWAAVLRGLRSIHPDHSVLLLGVRAEAGLNDEIIRLAGVTGTFNAARIMTVPRLMALSEGAAGIISVDTGPAHVAAAVGCGTLVLYTCPSTKSMYATRNQSGAVRHLVGGSDSAPSLLGISEEQVIAEWSQMHGASRPPCREAVSLL